MSFASLVGVELKKTRRTGIYLILILAVVILWLPSIFNAGLNFDTQAEGISPENNFFIQGFLGMTWFMYPAAMAVCTVMLIMTERSDRGLLKLLSLPVSPKKLCLSKFVALLFLSAVQIAASVVVYYISAFIAGRMQGYDFVLPLAFVMGEALMMFLSAMPMLAFFWMLAVCIRTPVFSIGIGLSSIVPSVLLINTRLWIAYPVSYPFYILTSEYGRLASKLDMTKFRLFPWLIFALAITALCLFASCARFGKAERN